MVSCSSIRLHPLRRSLHQGVRTLSGILHQKCELSGKIGVLEKHGTHSRDPQKPCCANQPSLSFPALHFALPPRQIFFSARWCSYGPSTVLLLFSIHLPPVKEPKSLSQRGGPSLSVLILTLCRFDVTHYTLSYHLWQRQHMMQYH